MSGLPNHMQIGRKEPLGYVRKLPAESHENWIATHIKHKGTGTPKCYHGCCSLLALPGRGRSWITGLAGISGLGPNSEPRGNNRSFLETRERDRVPVKKIGSRDSIFGLINSTYSFKITNHNQHASNIKYLANLIKKYWTCFCYQKLADFLVCFPPSVGVQVRWPPSWKICLRIQLSFGFWSRAVKAFDNFSRKLAWLLQTIF